MSVCVQLQAGGSACYLDIGAPAHGVPERAAPPALDASTDHPWLRDVALLCGAEVLDTTALSSGRVSLCGQDVDVEVEAARVVVSARSLRLEGQLRFTGPRDVAWLVYGDVTLPSGAHMGVDAVGPQSGAGARGCVAAAGAVDDGGGAGGSHGTVGGDGGTNGGGDVGGTAAPATASSIHDVLERGCAGGAANYSTTNGGGAGGALQVTAGGTIHLDGALSANGGGGTSDASGGAAGGGGGSGGDLYLQAPRVLVGTSGVLTAQGGGGGAGSGNGATAAGADGPVDPTLVAGGASTAASTGGSGAGAAASGSLAAASAGSGAAAGAGAAGGGGGAGRIGVDLEEPCSLLAGAAASPTLDCR